MSNETLETAAATTAKPPRKARQQAAPTIEAQAQQAAIDPNLIAAIAQQVATAVGVAVAQNTPASTVLPPVETNRESFIVFNPRPGVLSVSDAKLQIDGFEAKDLTWEEDRFIKGSVDLKKALMLGLLVRITQEQYDQLLTNKVEREKANAKTKALKQRARMKKVKAEGVEFEAEEVSASSGNATGESQFTIEGSDNDPLMYAAAYHNALAASQAQGRFLDGETFHQMISNPQNGSAVLRYWANAGNTGLAPNVQFPQSSVSGETRRGRAVVAMPGLNDGDPTTQVAMGMTNFNRDQRIAGQMGLGGVLQNPIPEFNPYDVHFQEIEDSLAPGEAEDLMDDDDDDYTSF
ncbi:MAG: hypothetical protein ACAH17_00800 [Candidatus Paceibacterota bacterium]